MTYLRAPDGFLQDGQAGFVILPEELAEALGLQTPPEEFSEGRRTDVTDGPFGVSGRIDRVLRTQVQPLGRQPHRPPETDRDRSDFDDALGRPESKLVI
jgi:hypothetical protein